MVFRFAPPYPLPHRPGDVGGGCYTSGMSPIVIEVPDLAVSVESERPIGAPERVRVYIGPEIELVMSVPMADRLADAIDDNASPAAVFGPYAAWARAR